MTVLNSSPLQILSLLSFPLSVQISSLSLSQIKSPSLAFSKADFSFFIWGEIFFLSAYELFTLEITLLILFPVVQNSWTNRQLTYIALFSLIAVEESKKERERERWSVCEKERRLKLMMFRVGYWSRRVWTGQAFECLCKKRRRVFWRNLVIEQVNVFKREERTMIDWQDFSVQVVFEKRFSI